MTDHRHDDMNRFLPYCVLAVLALTDVLTTSFILANGGVEANPIADIALQHFGIPGLVGLRTTAFVLVVAAGEWLHARCTKSFWLTMNAVLAVNLIPPAAIIFQISG